MKRENLFARLYLGNPSSRSIEFESKDKEIIYDYFGGKGVFIPDELWDLDGLLYDKNRPHNHIVGSLFYIN